MPKFSDLFPSKYLKPVDLNGNRVTVTISHLTKETIGNDERPVLYFIQKQKPLILNKTNGNTIANVFGNDIEDWRGGNIVLFETPIDFQGKTIPAIRCTALPRKPEPKAPDLDDKIPF